MSHIANAFMINGKTYMRVTPVKSLFRSTMVHEVVTRGDVFAVDIETGSLTVLQGDAEIKPVKLQWRLQLELF